MGLSINDETGKSYYIRIIISVMNFLDYIIQLLTENRAMISYLKDIALPAKLNGCAHL